jgi:hypothetical protein
LPARKRRPRQKPGRMPRPAITRKQGEDRIWRSAKGGHAMPGSMTLRGGDEHVNPIWQLAVGKQRVAGKNEHALPPRASGTSTTGAQWERSHRGRASGMPGRRGGPPPRGSALTSGRKLPYGREASPNRFFAHAERERADHPAKCASDPLTVSLGGAWSEEPSAICAIGRKTAWAVPQLREGPPKQHTSCSLRGCANHA